MVRFARHLACWTLSIAGAVQAHGQLLERLEVTAPRAYVSPGETVQLRVTGFFDDGSTADLTAAATGTTYLGAMLDEGAAATISADGLATAVAEGFEFVVVLNGSASASFLLTVSSSPDGDGDGMPDAFETANGLDPADPTDAAADADGDGLTNREEFLINSDPHLADTDGDGASDRVEAELGIDPRRPDTDGDGRSDGQEIADGTDPAQVDSLAEPAPPRLDERCLATMLNRTTQVNPDGTFVLPNVPVPTGAIRVRFVCEQSGKTHRAQTPFALGVPNGATSFGDVSFAVDDPIPVALALSSPAPVLTAAAPGAQLVATGKLVDGTEVDLTLRESGTFYLSSNPAIATVSADGFVQAVSSGTFMVTATHEGVIATLQLSVSLTVDADGDGLPDDYERANVANPGGSNLTQLPSATVTASSFSASFPPSRAADGNLQTSWFTAVGDAANRRSSPFIEVAFAADQRVAQVRLLGNRQNSEGFDFIAGRFEAWDGAGGSIFDSGEVLLPAPTRDVAVPIDLDGVRRVRFTATADESNTPGLAEIQVISRPGGVGLDPNDPSDGDADFDSDGLSNRAEFALGTSIFLNDTDADGLTDAAEGPLGSNPILADTDNDGLVDGSELQPTADTDGDGLRNLLDPDSDNDGLPDGLEVRLRLDPLRTDSNFNGVPDGSEDSDGDGLPNGEEVLEHTDAANPDTDGDGLLDGEEVIPGADGFITDPLRADTDRDGMSDGYESAFGLDPTDPADAAADPDGDGLSNLEESRRGTDPFDADTTPPGVSQVAPLDGATGVAANSSIIVRFTEPLGPASVVAGTVSVVRGSIAVAGTLALSSDRLSVTFTPTGGLEGLSPHTVRVTGVRDAAGNRMVALFESTFTTAIVLDTTRPTVVRTSPTSSQSAVPVNAPIVVEFSERMDPASLSPTSFTLRENVGFTNVAGSVQVDPDGRTASFVPNRPLAVGRSHSAFLNTSLVRDAAGNLLSGSSAWSFTTSFQSDAGRPVLLGVSPADGATAVPVNALVVLQFSEPINPLTLARGVTVRAGAAPVAGSFALSDGNRRLTFTSAAAFAAGQSHSVTVTTELTDLVGNPLDNPSTATFSTGAAGDVTRPSVATLDPASGATNVGVDARITVQFNEVINPITVTSTTFQLTHNATGAAIAGAITVGANGRSAVLVPSAPLEGSTFYRIQLTNEINDLAGQQLNFSSTTFRTAAGADVIAPTVVALSPPNGAAGVPINARVVVLLSEPIAASSIAADSIVVSAGGTPVPGAIATSSDRTTLVWTGAAALAPATAYGVAVGNLVDRSGNPLAPVASSFSTAAVAAADTTRPQLVAIVPANGATGVPVGTAITWTFSEPLDPSSVNATSLPVTVDGFSGNVPGTYALAEAAVTFVPLSPFPADRRIRTSINFDGVRDFAGNGSTFSTTSFVVGSTADVTPPEVLLVTPSDGATGVGPNPDVVLTFSEPLDASTVNGQTFDVFANGGRLSAAVFRSSDNRTVTLTTSLPAASEVSVVATSDVRDLSGNRLADFESRFSTAPSFDGSRPSVVSQRPGNGATGVAPTSSIVLYANEQLAAATIPGALFVAQNGDLVGGQVAITGNGRAIEFRPDAPFAPSALIQIFLTADAKDVRGNALSAYEASFRIAADPATLAPSVVRTSPGNGAIGVPTNAVVELEYSEPLDPATVGAASVALRQNVGAGPVVASTISLVRGGRVVRIVPSAPLLDGQQYYVQVTTALRDLQGQSPGSTQNHIFFRPGPTIDVTPPAVEALSPPSGQAGVGLNARVRVRFSEPIDPLSVDPSTVAITAGAIAVVPSSISFGNGDRDVLVVPQAPLAAATVYEVSIAGVEDLAGNPVGAVSATFATSGEPDTTAPVVVRSTPTSGQTNVPVNAVVAIETSEPIDALTVSSSTFFVRENTTFTSLPGTLSTAASLSRIDFAPSAPLPVGRSHSVFYSNQGIEDFSGNRLSGPGTSFTTSFAADTTPPAVLVVSPADGATAVPTNGRVSIRFDEPIAQPSSLGVAIRRGGVDVAIARSLSDANRLLTLTPLGPLAPLATYDVEIAGVTDLAGNVQASTVVSGFATRSGADLVTPSVVQVDPANGSSGAGVNSAIALRFSEVIDTATLSTSTVTVTVNQTGVPISGSLAIDADRRGVVFRPDRPLPPSTILRVQATSEITDLAAQRISFFTSTFTTGAAADGTPPTVRSIAPPNGVADVPVNARIAVRLSEPVALASVTSAAIRASVAGVGSAGTIAVSTDRMTVTFTPSAPWPAAASVTVEVGGFTDVAGNLVVPASAGFSTSASTTADTTRPALVSIVPANGAVGVPVETPITWTFNEPIDPGTADGASLPISIDGISGNVPGSYSTAGPVITFTPLVPWPNGVRVRSTINSDGLRDYAGNGSLFSQFSFVTAGAPDVTPPSVLLVTPSDGAVDVGLNAQVVLTFSEPLDPGSVNAQSFELFVAGDRLNASVSRSSDNRTVTLSTTLPANATVTVVATGDVRDLSGNRLAEFVSSFTTAAQDSGRPTVVGQRPGNGASAVAPTTSVVLYVNEPLDPASVPGALFVSQNGVLVPGAVELTGNGRAIEMTPFAPFAPSALIQVFLTSTAVDRAGNALTPYEGSLRIAGDSAALAPTVLRTFPESGATTGIAVNTHVELEMSEAIDPATLTGTSVTLRQNAGAGPVIPTTITLLGGRTIRLVPTAPLLVGQQYYVQVNSGLRDLTGQAFAGTSNFIFFRPDGATADLTAPTVTSIAPPDGEGGVGLNARVRVRFSETIDPLTVDGATILLTDGATGAVPCTISFGDEDRDVLVVPHSPLRASTVYTIRVDGVMDGAGNAVVPAVTTFTTGTEPDTTGPVALRTNPFSGATQVPVNTTVTLDLTEPVDMATVGASTFILRENATFTSIPGSYSASASGRRLILMPAAPLPVNRSHSVFFSNQGIEDFAGNRLTGSSASFTTASAPDATPPAVVELTPRDGWSGVPINGRIAVRFDEPIATGAVEAVTLVGPSGTVAVRRLLADANRQLTLVPVAVLAPSASYTVTVGAVEDLAGNALAAPVVASFSTALGADLVRPAVSSVTPPSGSTGVSRTAPIVVQFSERIATPTFAAASFQVIVNSTGAAVAGTVTLAADGRSATFTPSSPLASSTLHRVRVFTEVTDLAGNGLPFFDAVFTTGP